MNKLKKLKEILNSMGSVLVAYSAGVDSTFLLKISRDTLKDKVLAVTAASAIYPKDELAFSKRMARSLKVRHKIIKTFELNNKQFISNSVKRCYFCKKELFAKLKKIARQNKLNFVVDASNLSDKDDFRPGEQAARELNIRSPLKEAGFTKDDIRKVLKKDIPRLINKRNLIIDNLKRMGYDYVTVDLEGYRTGSMNLG